MKLTIYKYLISIRNNRTNKILVDDVYLAHLAKITKNYTKVDFESMVKLVYSNVLCKGINFNKAKKFVKVNMKNFIDAFSEIQPTFDFKSTEIENSIQFGMINY